MKQLILILSLALILPINMASAEDGYEREADSVAEKVISRPAPTVMETKASTAARKAVKAQTATNTQSAVTNAAQKMSGPLGSGDCNPICGMDNAAEQVSQPAQ